MYEDKELIVFDVDDTLTKTTTPMDEEMSNLFTKLLEKNKVAIISGGKYEQMKKQIVDPLNCSENLLEKLFLFPTCASQYYKYKNEWIKVYAEELTKEEISKIFLGFDKALEEYGFKEELYGERIEDRKSQVTFSALGNLAPVEKKSTWDINREKRKEIIKILEKYLPEFDLKIGGTSSIDVTRKGIDKAYGIRKIEENLKIEKKSMLFIGDALFPGGNDYPVKQVGVDCIQVNNPEDTKKIIRQILTFLVQQ